MEYAAAGIPIVTTDVGGSRELFSMGDLGELVSGGNSRLLGEAIIKLLIDKQRMNNISNFSGKLIAEEFDWNVKITEIEQYYFNKLNIDQQEHSR